MCKALILLLEQVSGALNQQLILNPLLNSEGKCDYI